MPRPIRKPSPPIDARPLTVDEFRRGVTAIVEAIGKLSANRYYKRITDEWDQWSVSFGAPTLAELEEMERKEFPT